VTVVGHLYNESVGPYGQLVRTTPGRSRLPAPISVLLLIVVSSATAVTVAFSRGGGILVGVIVFMAGYRFRRQAVDRGKKLSW